MLDAVIDIEFDWLYFIGTVSFTVTGYLIGARKQFDLLGVCILALLTAIGGGMIRDVLVNSVPRIFLDASPLYTIFATLALAWLLKLERLDSHRLQRVFIVADSIGLVAFSIAGAQLGLALGLNAFAVAFLGFVTAVGGGLVRDMLCNDVPFILHEDFYGTVAILVAVVLYGLFQLGWVSDAATWLLFAGGLALRLFAHQSELRLPKKT
ncbi:trimeric intracellular cation channel family protein [Chitinilyticum piscinae]|uniref:Trimeric intracellular cation channel family protein n=1 Tax=Chitinilyticum piscinae TaxID=2866724 RepID=A0A8J7FR67_9NEIS|nr:trimeric intracellular cation channel family protein [Chitinilyticum piscinae]MBE9610784.1 trimeric intracellular cation channel family protein [Chitinilyticum piscinae]